MNYWVVRGSPKENGKFEIIRAGIHDEWRTKKPPSTWTRGDRLIFWASSPRRELIALGEFGGLSGRQTADGQYLYHVRYLTDVVREPVTQDELRADSVVKGAIFLKVGPASSVVRVSIAEGEQLYRRLLEKNPDMSSIWPDVSIAKAQSDRPSEESGRENWSREELKAAIVAYFEIRDRTHAGETVVKRDYYVQLAKRFGRTEKAFEYRMQNISYVLSVQGREWLEGLRPARNVGTNVAAQIAELIAEIEGRPASPEVSFETRVRVEASKPKLAKPAGIRAPRAISAQTTQFDRDPKVKAWVLVNANGACECCGGPAPFTAADGSLFLEVHHVRRLADGGSDSVENTVALCPNCHRQLHHGIEAKILVERLYATIQRLLRE